jgi:hypothetical protein
MLLLAAHSVAGSLARSQFAVPVKQNTERWAFANKRDVVWPSAPAYSSDITKSLMATEARRQTRPLTVASSFNQLNENISLAKRVLHRKPDV